MFSQLVQPYSRWMVSTFGFEKAVLIEDGITNICIFVLGMLTMALISSNFILKLHSIEDFGKSKIKLVQVDRGKHTKLIIHITNIWSAFERGCEEKSVN